MIRRCLTIIPERVLQLFHVVLLFLTARVKMMDGEAYVTLYWESARLSTSLADRDRPRLFALYPGNLCPSKSCRNVQPVIRLRNAPATYFTFHTIDKPSQSPAHNADRMDPSRAERLGGRRPERVLRDA